MERCTMRDNSGTAYLKAEYDTADTLDQAVEKLAEYEDAEEAGYLVRLPAPIGTPVYWPLMDCDFPDDEDCEDTNDFNCRSCKHCVPKILTESLNYYMLDRDGGLSVGYCLTKEEAEKKIEGFKKKYASKE